MEDKAIRGVPWTVLSYAGGRLISILTTLVLARLVAPADFGLLALAALATNFLYWIADMGFSGALVLNQDLDDRGKGTLLSLMAMSGVLAGLIALALSPVAAAVFDAPRLEGVLAVTAAGLPLGSVAGFWGAILQREFEFRIRFYSGIAQALVAAAISIPMAALGAGVWSLVVGQLASTVTLLTINMACAPYRVRPAFDRRLARISLHTGRGFVGQGLFAYLRQQVDTVTVGAAFGTRDVGFYSMANKLGDLVYWVLAHPVAVVTFPSFAKQRSAGHDIRPAFLRVLAMVTLVACPIGIIMSAAAEPFTRVFFGEQWMPMAGPLAIMGLWATARQIDTTIGWLLNSIGRAGAAAWLSVFVLGPLIIGCVLAATYGDLTTVALVPLADTLLSGVIGSVLAKRFGGLGYGAQWRALRPPVLASIPTWFAAWGAAQLVGLDHAPIGLAVAITAGIAVYVATVSLIEPGVVPQAVGRLTRMLGRGRGGSGSPARREPEAGAPLAARTYLRAGARSLYRLLKRTPAAALLRLPLLERARRRVTATSMSLDEVLEIVAMLADAGVESWLMGGWGIDALMGEQTRDHADADLVVRRSQHRQAVEAFERAGFAVREHWGDGLLDLTLHLVNRRRKLSVELSLVDLDAARWVERVRELADGAGFEVDALVTWGKIGGHAVNCVSPELQLALHLGYVIHDEDRADVKILCRRFSLPVPAGYRHTGDEVKSAH